MYQYHNLYLKNLVGHVKYNKDSIVYLSIS